MSLRPLQCMPGTFAGSQADQRLPIGSTRVSLMLDGMSSMCAAGPEALKAFTGLYYLKRDILHFFIKLSFIRLSGCVCLVERLKHDSGRQSRR